MRTELNMRVARGCAGWCRASYGSVTLRSGLAHVLVGEVDGMRVLAFRGSAETRDWVTNARIGLVNLGAGCVHKGFWDSMSSVLGQVRVLDQRERKEPVLITGHSKGGAEALLCAWALAREGWPVAGVYTFGGPRVGDWAWRKNYNGQAANVKGAMDWTETLGAVTWRFVHQADGVARLPVWLQGWRHVGTEVLLPSTGGVVARPRWWFKAAQSLAGIWREWTQGRLAVAADHPVERYVERLGKS